MTPRYLREHEAAMRQVTLTPSPRHHHALHETALAAMLKGWLAYVEAHYAACGSLVSEDGVLGEEWKAIGQALHGLLNGERGRLDSGIMSRKIHAVLSTANTRTALREADVPAMEKELATTDATTCECGESDGQFPCAWSGPESATVLVETMPAQFRSSHIAAGNRGIYPYNGAKHFRCAVECAARLVRLDSDWTSIVSAGGLEIGDRIVAGEGADRDVGRVVAFRCRERKDAGVEVSLAWDSEVSTWYPATMLRRESKDNNE